MKAKHTNKARDSVMRRDRFSWGLFIATSVLLVTLVVPAFAQIPEEIPEDELDTVTTEPEVGLEPGRLSFVETCTATVLNRSVNYRPGFQSQL